MLSNLHWRYKIIDNTNDASTANYFHPSAQSGELKVGWGTCLCEFQSSATRHSLPWGQSRKNGTPFDCWRSEVQETKRVDENTSKTIKLSLGHVSLEWTILLTNLFARTVDVLRLRCSTRDAGHKPWCGVL